MDSEKTFSREDLPYDAMGDYSELFERFQKGDEESCEDPDRDRTDDGGRN